MKAKGIRRRVTRLSTTARSLGIEGKAVDDSTDWEGLWSNPKLQIPNPNHSQLPNPKAKSQGQIPRPKSQGPGRETLGWLGRLVGILELGSSLGLGSWEWLGFGIWSLGFDPSPPNPAP